jgi:hypothetical protein
LHGAHAKALVAKMTRNNRPSTPSGAPTRRRVSRDGSSREAWAWADSHRGRPPIAPPPSAGRAASRLIKPMSAKFGPGANELQANWTEIVGEALAAYSSPVKFQSGAGGLALVINARGPAASLIEAQSAQILDRVARFSGRAPKRLKLTQGALKSRPVNSKSRPSRVVKVKALSPEPKGLEAVMNAFEAAVFAPRGKRKPGSNTE